MGVYEDYLARSTRGAAAPTSAAAILSQIAGRERAETYVPPAAAGVGLGAGAAPLGLLPEVPQAPPPPIGPLAAIPAALGAVGIGLPAGLAALLGIAGAGYGVLQAMGLGEGGGLFGLNILGGDDYTLGGLEFGGPGLAEPTLPYTEWHVGNKQFYHVPIPTATGKYKAKVAMYNKDTGRWKVWNFNPPHLAVIGKNMPRHQMITRLRRNLKRHTADAKTILQVSSPAYYAKMHGYKKYKRR